MPLTILDATTAANCAAATTRQAWSEALIAAWAGGNVTARLFAPDGTTLRRTLTLAPFTINATDDKAVVCGAHLADTAVSTGAPGLWVFRPGSTDIFSLDAGTGAASINHVGNIKTLCTPTLEGVTIPADPSLPTGTFTPGHTHIALMGQSNALSVADRSDISASPLSSDAGLATYDAGTFARVYVCNIGETTFAQLQPSVNARPDNTAKFGPEFGLAVRWMRETTTGNLYIHKQAVSGNPISQFDPSIFPGNDMFSRMGSALSWIAGQGVTLAQWHFLWVQGESDSSALQSYYQPRLQQIIDELYTQSILTTGSISVLAQMASGTSGYGQGVFDAKAAIAAADPTEVKTAQMQHYGPDNLHINARGQVQLGYDAFALMFGRSTITV